MPSNSSPEPGFARHAFVLPRAPDGGDAVYLAGNSLGAQPRAARDAVLAAMGPNAMDPRRRKVTAEQSRTSTLVRLAEPRVADRLARLSS